MSYNSVREFSTEFAGRTLKVQVGKLALHTNASCLVQYGDTVILATAVMAPTARENIDYFPLMIDYEEKMYAAGKIKGSRFIKREGRPTDVAILSGRMIDRGLRPLFPAWLRNEVQVVLTVLSCDGETDPALLSITAASIVLHISSIPWNGPLAGVSIGRVNGEWMLNPSSAAELKSDCSVSFSAATDKVLMFEADAKEITEDDFAAAVEFGLKQSHSLLKFIEEVRAEVGQSKITEADLKQELAEADFPLEDTPQAALEAEAELAKVQAEAESFILQNLEQYLFNQPRGTKRERHAILAKLEAELEKHLLEKQVGKENRKKILEGFEVFIERQISKAIIEQGRRVDGRSLDDIRPLTSEVGLLPRTHGSALFNRGETQILTTVTLGAPGDEQVLDSMEEDGKKRYMHHYNDAPFSYGETGPLRGPGRRAIGHGALAEKALLPVLPGKEAFPYTIRLVSEVLSSNGSSSMGSTCGSSLALMDAGVPITKHVAGIAMGLATDEAGTWKIFTDLQDLEDGPGGMDFKVAGTADGITAAQMDTKTDGLTIEMIRETLAKAKVARLKVLEVMTKAIPAPRTEMSPYAPRIVSVRINPERIRDVIGPGGKQINEITATCGVEIDIEDDGLVMITGVNAEGVSKAVEIVKNLTRDIVAGEVFEGKVVRIMDFGAFVELMPKKDGLVHVSEISTEHVANVTDVLNLGDVVKVIVKEIDDQGRISLSMKRLDPDWLTKEQAARANGVGREGDHRPSSPRPPRPGGFGGRPSGPRRPRF